MAVSSSSSRSRSSRWSRSRPPVNVAPAERAARVAVGLGGAAAGSWLLDEAGGPLAAVLALLLVLAGLDLLVTGALGYCPLYRRLGRAPRRPMSAR